MVRCILTCAALAVAGAARAEFINFYPDLVRDQDSLERLLAIDAGADDTVHFTLFGALWTLEGSWDDGTAELVGHFKAPPEPGFSVSYDILPEVIRVPLERTHSWSVYYTPLGYYRGWWPELFGGSETEIETYENNSVGINQLNEVRNKFGRTAADNRFGIVGLADLTYDDVVDIDDLNTVRNRFGTPLHLQLTLPLEAAAVPEPAALRLLALGLFGLAARRGRFRCRSWR